MRAAGFKGYSCNLQLIGQSRGDGGSWQHAFFADQAGHKCNYYDTASFTANRSHLGVVAIDATNAANPTPTAYLETTAMLDPWESLKVNERRQMLGAVNALNGNAIFSRNNSIGTSLGQVQSILQGRIVRLAFQMKF